MEPIEPPVHDARIARTRRKLHEAALALAAKQPIESVTVADLTRTARINRSTFYKHASSPGEALQQALYDTLDERRDELVHTARDVNLSLARVWEQSLAGFAEYLRRFEGVYTTGLVGGHSPALRHLVAQHFAAAVADVLTSRPGVIPAEYPRDPVAITTYSRFIGHGLLGAVETWLELPVPRDPQVYVRTVLAVMPEWLVAPAGG
ncbi:TetR/AcrR family transcriptional regulator [Amycolatopsis sp. A1MSW2902]|uniref:TetR/AcrR family transcriptional regulator n=1 Tax=Amycolatopsis sp. A1MSW2902 TaxID=687413 RepID=UPI00307F9554